MSKDYQHKALFLSHPFLSPIRLTFLTLCTVFGLYQGHSFLSEELLGMGLGTISGAVIGCTTLWIEFQLTKCSRPIIYCSSLGILLGLTATALMIMTWNFAYPEIPDFSSFVFAPSVLVFPYLGIVIGVHFARAESTFTASHSPTSPPKPFTNSSQPASKLLDTSAIIDGRVLQLCLTGFLEGPLFIPKCVLREIHLIADSEEASKRIKGKRGLEILTDLQKFSQPEIVIVDDHDSQGLPVDHQLIAIAKTLKAKIVTNDWNLARIAHVQGVQSLNVNELTFHLRPLVLPGEIIRVFIQKEGQGFGQGIAHLDDGTMVVIDHGATFVSQTIDVEVTRFMQTNTGRMVFAFPKPPAHSSLSKRSSHSQATSSGVPIEPAGRNQ